MSMEAVKSQGLSSASWKPRKASRGAWRPETCRAGDSNHESQGQERSDVRAQTIRQSMNSLLLCLLVLFGLSVDWTMPTHVGEGAPPHSIHQLNCWPLGKPTQKHPEMSFNQVSGHPMSGHVDSIRLTITKSNSNFGCKKFGVQKCLKK